jgi:hypothetical protein
VVRLWVVTKAYDIEHMQTNIVSVEDYYEFIRKNSPGTLQTMAITGTDMVWAVDAIGAWKQAKEVHDERY